MHYIRANESKAEHFRNIFMLLQDKMYLYSKNPNVLYVYNLVVF
jgi:hypothetical protein